LNPRNIVAGVDYPFDEDDLFGMLLTQGHSQTRDIPKPLRERLEEGSRGFLARIRNWPQGHLCPSCDARFTGELRSRGRAACSNCSDSEETVTSGTYLHANRIKLFDWLHASWLVSQNEMPETAKSLTKKVGLESRPVKKKTVEDSNKAVRVGVSPKAAIRVLSTLRAAMGRINSRLADTDSTQFSVSMKLKERDAIIKFSLGKRWSSSALSQDSESDEGAVKRWVLAEVIDIVVSKPLIAPPTRASSELLKRWNSRLRRADAPNTKIELELFLMEFVFLENHRSVRNRGKIFYELVQELVSRRPRSPKVVRSKEGRGDREGIKHA